MEEREYMEEQRQLVQTYMKGGDNMTICRRVTLDAYLDGMVDRISCKEGEELCDVCTGEIHEESDEISVDMVGNEKEMERVEMQHEFQQQERERRRPREQFMDCRQQEHLEIEWLRRQLHKWSNHCGVCEAQGLETNSHGLMECCREESGAAKVLYEKIKRGIKFDKYSGCYWCGVPQDICSRWENNGQGKYRLMGEGSCQYKGVLISAILGIISGHSQVWDQWC